LSNCATIPIAPAGRSTPKFYPDGVDRTRVHTRFYIPRPVANDAEKAYWDQTIDFSLLFVTTEDFPQQERIFSNLRTEQLPAVHFGRNEPSLTHYHRCLAQQLALATDGPVNGLATKVVADGLTQS